VKKKTSEKEEEEVKNTFVNEFCQKMLFWHAHICEPQSLSSGDTAINK
jgi:hypothetical protein